eukprot:15552078-Heterocapsa_arctica.AAC.1
MQSRLLSGHLVDSGRDKLVTMLQTRVPSLSPDCPREKRSDGVISDSVLVGHNEWTRADGKYSQRKNFTTHIGLIPVTD